ncbi:MAG: hypothetical protein K0U38_00190 [Epsilonproteobacteria bacterium]|nr:hypothetical protein [Campylobacterota bacterium]
MKQQWNSIIIVCSLFLFSGCIGGEPTMTTVQDKGLKMDLEATNPDSDANVHVGKIDFYVK